jgi:hypothetical protein
MMWLAFCAGIMVGTLVGVVAVALCQMMSRDREHRRFGCHSDSQYDSFSSPLLLKDTK